MSFNIFTYVLFIMALSLFDAQTYLHLWTECLMKTGVIIICYCIKM